MSLTLTLFTAMALAGAQGGDTVWIEAENAASSNLKLEASGWGNTQFLSEGKWVNVNIEADKVGESLPGAG
jgi:hypothetical protein